MPWNSPSQPNCRPRQSTKSPLAHALRWLRGSCSNLATRPSKPDFVSLCCLSRVPKCESHAACRAGERCTHTPADAPKEYGTTADYVRKDGGPQTRTDHLCDDRPRQGRKYRPLRERARRRQREQILGVALHRMSAMASKSIALRQTSREQQPLTRMQERRTRHINSRRLFPQMTCGSVWWRGDIFAAAADACCQALGTMDEAPPPHMQHRHIALRKGSRPRQSRIAPRRPRERHRKRERNRRHADRKRDTKLTLPQDSPSFGTPNSLDGIPPARPISTRSAKKVDISRCVIGPFGNQQTFSRHVVCISPTLSDISRSSINKVDT